jgi:hypothetical protein
MDCGIALRDASASCAPQGWHYNKPGEKTASRLGTDPGARTKVQQLQESIALESAAGKVAGKPLKLLPAPAL